MVDPLYIYWTERQVGIRVIRSYTWLRLPHNKAPPRRIEYSFFHGESIPMELRERW